MWLPPAIGTLPPEQQQRWLRTCHVPSAVDALFADPERSVVALTHAGCGLTTSLALLPDYGLLSFPYNPEQWPGQPDAFTEATTHFGQWMSLLAVRLADELRADDARLRRLTPANHEYLVWLLRRYLGRRQSATWLDHLRPRLDAATWQELSAAAGHADFEQLYGDTVADLYGQIDECLAIAECLGWKGIYAAIDIRWADWLERDPDGRRALLDEVKRILTTLTPLQRPRFGIKMGLPRQIVSPPEVYAWVRGRATVCFYEWSQEDLCEITARLLAPPDAQPSAEHVAQAQALWHDLAPDIVSIWGAPVPAAAVALAQLVSQPPPVSRDEQRSQLYKRSAILRMDSDSGQRSVWRGMTRIALDEMPYSCFEVLWRHRGAYASNDALLEIATTRQNLDKNIQRLRESIEPFYKEKRFLYIERSASSGTRLVRELCAFS